MTKGTKGTKGISVSEPTSSKAQTSTEFVIILAAVALFSVFAIALFSHVQNSEKLVYSAIGNIPASVNTVQSGPSNGIFIYSSIPNTTYVNRSYALQVLLSYPSGYALSSIYVMSNNAIAVTPSSYNGIQYALIEAERFSVVPLLPGPINITAIAVFDSGGGNAVTVQSVSRTFAEVQNTINSTGGVGGGSGGGYPPGALSAYISHKNESEFYPESSTAPVDAFGWWSHCSYHNWDGSLETEPEQCGIYAHTWGFNTQDYQCNPFNFQDQYYCFSRNPTGFSVSQIKPSPSYLYNITLLLGNATLSLHSKLSSSAYNAALLGANGAPHGYASVNAAYGSVIAPLPYLSYALLNYGSAVLRPINVSNYSVYYYAEQNLIGYLNSNNNTWNNGGVLNLIIGSISSVNTDAHMLMNATNAGIQGCSASVRNSIEGLACNAVLPFSYDINAYISSTGNAPAVNQSLLYQGSLISVT